jgi:transposase
VQTLVAHLEHLRTQITTLARAPRRAAGDDDAARALLASVPGFGRETVRTWLAELPPCTPTPSRRAPSRARCRRGKKPKHGADKLVAAVGLDAQVKQSGRWQGQVRMSKRGNRYVRAGSCSPPRPPRAPTRSARDLRGAARPPDH